MIKGLMFDLYDTLIYIDQDIFNHHRDRFCSLAGASREKVSEIWAKYIQLRFNGTIVTLRDMIEILLWEINVDGSSINIDELEEIEIKALTESIGSYQGVGEMLKNLRDSGIQLALVTNASYVSKFVLEKLPWIDHFHHLVISCDVKMAKPDHAIYRYTLQQMNLSPFECLFVGDGGSLELDGAMGVGIKTVKVVQERQDPSYKRSTEYNFLINSITELPEVLEILNRQSVVW
jgi:putative hydrolase of the HAD superfamily